jgi:hypothetical protein
MRLQRTWMTLENTEERKAEREKQIAAVAYASIQCFPMHNRGVQQVSFEDQWLEAEREMCRGIFRVYPLVSRLT